MSDTSGTGLFEADKLVLVARILMAAASVDGDYDGDEQEVIERVLNRYTDAERLPRSVLEALVGFDETVFTLSEELAGLGAISKQERRLLVECVAEVLAADGVFHVGEEVFIEDLGELLGLDPSDYAVTRATLSKLPAWKD